MDEVTEMDPKGTCLPDHHEELCLHRCLLASCQPAHSVLRALGALQSQQQDLLPVK